MPFRRLCANFGAEVTMSEMSFARMLLKGDLVEKARLRKAANEHCFGEPGNTDVSTISLAASDFFVSFTLSKTAEDLTSIVLPRKQTLHPEMMCSLRHSSYRLPNSYKQYTRGHRGGKAGCRGRCAACPLLCSTRFRWQ